MTLRENPCACTAGPPTAGGEGGAHHKASCPSSSSAAGGPADGRTAGASVADGDRTASDTGLGAGTGRTPGVRVGTDTAPDAGTGTALGVGAGTGIALGAGTGAALGLGTGSARVGTGRRSRTRRAWAELLRLPALFSVPGDALAGAAAAGARPGARTLLAIGSSLCLYEAGMALNDWADRNIDAVERPHRPLPSGRIRPAAALTAACALTGAGLALAARAGRPALAVAAPLAVTVWAYDLGLKHTPAGPLAMGAARGLDLLLGAAATTGRPGPALPSAALLGTHTVAVTTVSRHEAQGGAPLAPLAALATTALLTRLVTHRSARPAPGRPPADALGASGPRSLRDPSGRPSASTLLTGACAAAYAATAARPYVHAALNPSPPLTQRAVGAGIRATIPLQAALTARARGTAGALLIAALAPMGAKFAKKVSVT